MNMVDDLNNVYEHEFLTEELTWKEDGYKSKDIDGFDFYLGYDFVPSQDDDCYLGSEFIQDDDMLCDSLQDAEDLLCNSSCFSDCYKSFTCNSLMCSHVPTLHDFEEEIIFSSDSDGFGSDEDTDIKDVLQMDYELCIPFGSELFPHHADIIPQDLRSKYSHTCIKGNISEARFLL